MVSVLHEIVSQKKIQSKERMEGGQVWSVSLPTSNISKLPILKEQEILPLGNFHQASNSFLGPIINYIGVGLEYADVVTDFFRDAQ